MSKKLLLSLVGFIIVLPSCKEKYSSEEYLASVLSNLDKIESASYLCIGEAWHPGDTVAAFILTEYVEEYKNSSDTTIGSKFVRFDSLTNEKAVFCYDGKMRADFYHDKKGIVIDSFTVRKLPFRPITPPFYNYVTSILKYVLTTEDSIDLDVQEIDNDVFVRLTINEEKQVEFFGRAYHIPLPPYEVWDQTSIYELWIDKKTALPYKVRREMSHDISVTICKKPEFNKLDIADFKATDYFPEDYIIKPYRMGKRNAEVAGALLNKEAPYWALTTENDQLVSLADIKSKVLMLQFTSVSCGPCKASIPFLEELNTEYKASDFSFVAIESTSNNTNVLKGYKKRNSFNYKFLKSTKEVLNDYSIKSYPVFYILDENRVVKKVIHGYGKSVDNQIREIVDEMI